MVDPAKMVKPYVANKADRSASGRQQHLTTARKWSKYDECTNQDRLRRSTLTGYDRLHNPRLNKGTAFTEAERRAWSRRSAAAGRAIAWSCRWLRRHDEIASLDDDLQKYLVLSDLQARNETLYLRRADVGSGDLHADRVYTTVGEACQKFGHIFRQPRGIYLPISAAAA